MVAEPRGAGRAAGASRPRLVLATMNRHKLTELTRILESGRVEVEIVSLAEFPGAPDVAETGATFAENALLKAHAVAEFTGLPAIADDSGLCVDALNGMPGVLSARWSGKHGDDVGNLCLVLGQLADVPDERRGAQFTCVAALALPDRREHVAEGIVSGKLIRAPRGENGFGYDPIFLPAPQELKAVGLPDTGQTTAEMEPADKDRISHRGKALRGLAPVIAALLG
ncbi:MAG: RdgB/HAM1 family non-canonical purine NTP pyrophosphatase [Streptosporangiaceae bacterium]